MLGGAGAGRGRAGMGPLGRGGVEVGPEAELEGSNPGHVRKSTRMLVSFTNRSWSN